MATDDYSAAQADWHYASGKPDISAGIKHEPADFRVDEDLGFELTGEGEHLYLKVRKRDLSTTQAARCLAEAVGVDLREIGYSGMKDRRGECTQWFSLKLPPRQEASLARFENAQVTILATRRNQRKLRVGSHRHNRFRLLLRHCRGPREEFERRLRAVQARGVPNYFGAQRFGRDMSNMQQVVALFRQARAGGDPGGRARRGMLYSAARAYLFNQVLSRRLAEANWSQYVEGDVLNLDDTGRFFVVAERAWDDALEARLDDFDIHVTGPLVGMARPADKYTSRRQAAALEGEVLARFPLLVDGLRARRLAAARRPLRYRVRNLRWEWRPGGASDLALDFLLPRGAYATSLLREVCLTHQPERESLN